jgi:hypothetical protein
MMEKEKDFLRWEDIKKIGYYKGQQWHPDASIWEYFRSLRRPSHAWPHSYANAARTYKFAKWLKENRPEMYDTLRPQAKVFWEEHQHDTHKRHVFVRQEPNGVNIITQRLLCTLCEFPEPLRQYLFSTPIEVTPITLPVEDLDEAKRLAEVSSLMEVSGYA